MASRERVNEVTIKGKRHYELPTGDVVPSVTTFLNVLPKPALDTWKRKMISEWAFDNQESWKNLPREAAVKVLKDSCFYDNTSAQAGDLAHGILESRARGYAEEDVSIEPGFEMASTIWDEFVGDFEVEVLHAEPQLINYTVGYAGSADLLARVNGQVAVVDYKSGNGLYGSTAYQLTAYGKAETLIDDAGDEVPMPEVEKVYGLWARPHGYALYPMEFSTNTWNIVRAAHMIWSLTSREYDFKGKPVNPNPIRSKKRGWFDPPDSE